MGRMIRVPLLKRRSVMVCFGENDTLPAARVDYDVIEVQEETFELLVAIRDPTRNPYRWLFAVARARDALWAP